MITHPDRFSHVYAKPQGELAIAMSRAGLMAAGRNGSGGHTAGLASAPRRPTSLGIGHYWLNDNGITYFRDVKFAISGDRLSGPSVFIHLSGGANASQVPPIDRWKISKNEKQALAKLNAFREAPRLDPADFLHTADRGWRPAVEAGTAAAEGAADRPATQLD